MERRPDPKNVRQVIAVLLTIAASLVLLIFPMYTEVELTEGAPPQVSHSTLLETVGPSIFVPLLIPTVLTALPLLIRGRARIKVSVAAIVALAVFVVMGSASIGWFYIPALTAAVAAVVAAMDNSGTLLAGHS